MPLTPDDLRRAAERIGGRVVDESSGRFKVFQVEAPAGKRWVANQCRTLRVEWLNGVADYRQAALGDGIDRIGYGIEPDPNTCPRCEGSGKYRRLGEPEKDCAVCNGTGTIEE